MKTILFIIFFSPVLVLGQAAAQQVFSVDDFIQQVKAYHPVAKQANLQTEKAKAALLSAQGSFDPTLNFSSQQKTFNGTNYYYYNNPELKIPTQLPITVKAGMEDNGGRYLTSEVTPGQSSYVGVEVALGKGLLTDKRRTMLKQAKLFQGQTEQDRLKMINDLMFDAYVAYWQWAGAFQQRKINKQFAKTAAERARLIAIAYTNGDKALTDTVEAYVQLQNYEIQIADAQIKLNNAALELSNYLWLEDNNPYQLSDKLIPDTMALQSGMKTLVLEELVQQALSSNPALQSYNYKLDVLEAEKKLKFQSLLPSINLKANLLNRGYYSFGGMDAAYFQNNYKYGIDFKMPLFFREGRGEYKKAKLKIQETSLEFEAKKWQVENKVRSYYSEMILLEDQLRIAKNNMKNYEMLLRNELLKYENGESSLFMINSRETKLLEAQQKLIDLKVKYMKAGYAAAWSAGLLL
ncbi:MAG: TolC family protein [Bacteroidota bacterium]|nr:TolC family protein [Bacteroidota bacterium]